MEYPKKYEDYHFIDTSKQVWNYSRFEGDDIANFQNGTNYRCDELFGSHKMEVMGTVGYYFAVWAPNATAVFVMGDFNYWNKETHPLYVRLDKSGIWEGFIPDLPQGSSYKYHIHGYAGQKLDKGDPYADRCRITAQLVAEALDLNEDEWAVSFQSRFGKQEWVKPYTDVVLQQWGEQKVKSVQVLSPAFSADCLETLEELAIENKETFQHAGGGEYAYIPALNSDQAHIDLLASLVQANLDALTHTLAHR